VPTTIHQITTTSAVAEMAMTLLMSLNRKIVMASSRIRMTNFTIDSSLMGMDIHGKTIGVLGTGKIGGILCDILLGYGVATLYCYDMYERDDLKAKGCIYKANVSEMYPHCDVIFVMLPLLEATHHTINQAALEQMKDGVLIVNTSRGGLVDTQALLAALQSGKVGGVGMDVYENEQAYFFQDWSARHVQDGSLLSLYVCCLSSWIVVFGVSLISQLFIFLPRNNDQNNTKNRPPERLIDGPPVFFYQGSRGQHCRYHLAEHCRLLLARQDGPRSSQQLSTRAQIVVE
jgi:lactate dehydrogenase-like 2-hydroxyacid dehydrogenase